MRRSDLFAAALSALLAGCGAGDDGPERAAVSGTVTTGGGPLAAGTVVFTPTAGGPRVTAPILRGAFALPADAGPAVGRNTARVVPADPAAPAPDDETAAARLASQRSRGEGPPRTRLPAPAEFEATVLPDAPNAFTFDLPPAR